MKEVVLITGGSGLIGSALATRLADRYTVVGLDTKPPSRPGALHLPLDLTSEESVRACLEQVRGGYGQRIASVLHLAAYYDFSGEPSPLYERVTVGGTERLVQALAGLSVEQIVFSSSMLVHAPCRPGERITERSPLEPRWDYPRSKVDAETVLQRRGPAIPLLILRIAGVYDDDCHSIPLANQIQRIFERRLLSHVFPGDLSHGQAFVHLDDVVEALVLAVDRRAALPAREALLIGEPETMSYQELQQELGRQIHDEDWATREIPKPLAKAGAWVQEAALPRDEEPFIKHWMIDLADDHYALDISRARRVLGWEPRRSLRATLPNIVVRLERDPMAFYAANELDMPGWLRARLEQERSRAADSEHRPSP